MTALDELRAALEELSGSISHAPKRSMGSIENTYVAQIGVESHARRREAADAALARVEAELAELRQRPTLEQVLEALDAEPWRHHASYITATSAIRALYGEAES